MPCIINTNKKNPVFHIRKKDGTIEKDIGGKLIFKRFISMSTDKIDNCLKEIKKNTNIIEYLRIEKNIKNYDKFIKNVAYELHIDNIKNINKDEYWDEEDEKVEEKIEIKNHSIENILNEYKNEQNDEFLLIVSKIRKLSKKKKITHILATQVWNEYIGMNIGQIKCPVCKVNEINQRNFECGHVIPESKGGETKIREFKTNM
jgi:Fe2+ transport system protein B